MSRPLIAMPALLTRMSSCLCSLPIALIASATDCELDTSKPLIAPCPPAASTSRATSAASCSRVDPFASGRKLTITRAPRLPRAMQIDLPMPCDPPVTSATLPESALSLITSCLQKCRDLVRLADRRDVDRVRDPLHEPFEHRARTELVRDRHARLR